MMWLGMSASAGRITFDKARTDGKKQFLAKMEAQEKPRFILPLR